MSILKVAVAAMCVFATACVLPQGQPAAGGGGGAVVAGTGGGLQATGGGGSSAGGGAGGGGLFGNGGGFMGGGGGFQVDAGHGGTGGGNDFDAGFCASPDTEPGLAISRQPPAISGGTMAVMYDGTAVVGDSDLDVIRIYDSANVEHDLALNAGDEPGRVTEGEPGAAFVALRGANAVVEVNTTSFMQLGRWSACAAPRGLAWNHAEQALYVACSSGELARFDFSQGTPVKTVTHPVDDLRDVLFFNGQLLVTTFRDAKVWAIASDGKVSLFGAAPVTSASSAPQVAWRTIATANGLVMSYQQEQTSIVPDSIPCVTSAYGGAGAFDGGEPIVAAALALITASGSAPLTDIGATNFPRAAALPVDVAVSADGKGLAVAYAGSNGVVYTSPDTGMTLSAFLNDALMPISVAFRGSDLLIFTRTLAQTAAGTVGPGRLVVWSNGTAGFGSNDTTTQTGHGIFHQATINQIACASCHPEGGEDGHVWQFTTGPRRTPTLRGGLSGTEPFHWSGDENDIGALMNDVLVVRMGGMSEPPAKLQSVLDWLDSLPARPPPAGLDGAAVARGAADFTSFGCDSCHSGALGTDNSTVDVGTGGLFQVPRLVELSYHAPFMHDGSAATLADRFTAVGGIYHPGSSGLTQQEIDDLVAYLKSR